MGLLDRLTERLGQILDDVRVPEWARRELQAARDEIERGEPAAANERLRRLDEALPGLWRTALLRGLAAEASGDDASALAALERALEIRPAPEVHLVFARIFRRRGDLTTARRHVEAALESVSVAEERRELLEELAALYEGSGVPQLATAALREARKLAPDDEALALRLARALEAEGDLAGAHEVLRPFATRDSATLVVLLAAAAIAAEAGEEEALADAARWYERVLARSPDNPDALAGIAFVCEHRGQWEKAIDYLRGALRSAPPGRHAALHARVGRCHAALGRSAAALDAYRAAVGLDPGRSETTVALARAAVGAGSFAEALDATEEISTDVAEAERVARATRGRALLALGQVDEAKRVIAPLRLRGGEADVLLALGELALATGDATEALRLADEARDAAPEDGLVVAAAAAVAQRAREAFAPTIPPAPPPPRVTPDAAGDLLDAVTAVLATEPTAASYIAPLGRVRRALERPLTVAIVGEFNAGKSTLLNAFVGERMLATGVLPTTQHVNEIRYGPRRAARVTDPNGVVEEIGFDEAAERVKRHPEQVAAIEFTYPHPALRAVRFWDTPGFNAPDPEHELRAKDALQRAEAIVWIVDANQPLKQSEWARLSGLAAPEERVVIVINKMDRLADEEQRREVIEHVREGVGGRCAAILPLSALRALELRQESTDPSIVGGTELEGTGWPAFGQLVEERLLDRGGRLKAIDALRRADGLMADALSELDARTASVERALEPWAALRRDGEARRIRWYEETDRCWRGLASALREVSTKMLDDVRTVAAPSGRLVERRTLAEADRAFLRQRFLSRTEGALRGAVDELVASVEPAERRVVDAADLLVTALGPVRGATIRRRVETFLAEAAHRRRRIAERVEVAWGRVMRARLDELGSRIFDTLAGDFGRTEAERRAVFAPLVAIDRDTLTEDVAAWGEEYLDALAALCGRVEREVDILAIEVDYRIMRPLRGLRESLTAYRADRAERHADPTDPDTA